METMAIALTVFFLSLAISELKDFHQLSFFALLQGLALLPLTLTRPEGFAVRLAVSLAIFALLLYFIRRTGVKRETAAPPSTLSLSALGILLVTAAIVLSLLKASPTTMAWALSIALGLFIILLKRDLFKVVLGVYVAVNASHGFLLGLAEPAFTYILFDLSGLMVVAVMLWTAILIYERYGSLDAWRANLLRW